jgi:putative transposase
MMKVEVATTFTKSTSTALFPNMKRHSRRRATSLFVAAVSTAGEHPPHNKIDFSPFILIIHDRILVLKFNTLLNRGKSMRAPFTQLYVHLVWSTWDRLPLIDEAFQHRLFTAIAKKCRKLKCEPIAFGGIEDHIHLLVRFSPAISIADLVKEIKGSSSHLMTHEISPNEFFKWQGGYGAFTVSKDNLPKVHAYISNQKEHHQEGILEEAWELSNLNDD